MAALKKEKTALEERIATLPNERLKYLLNDSHFLEAHLGEKTGWKATTDKETKCTVPTVQKANHTFYLSNDDDHEFPVDFGTITTEWKLAKNVKPNKGEESVLKAHSTCLICGQVTKALAIGSFREHLKGQHALLKLLDTWGNQTAGAK